MLPDRHVAVPPGHFIKYSYVNIHEVKLACKDRMAVGDVDRAYQKLIRIAPAQSHPAPFGYFEKDGFGFVIQDGRHQYVAALMLGYSHILVCWLQEGDIYDD